jgi:hypothetical protein
MFKKSFVKLFYGIFIFRHILILKLKKSMKQVNRTPQYDLMDLRGRQIFADPPAMRGTSGQVYTDNIIIS